MEPIKDCVDKLLRKRGGGGGRGKPNDVFKI